MHPGIDNQQVLEMTNFSPMPLRIHPGTAICQFIFQKTIGEARYSGRFNPKNAVEAYISNQHPNESVNLAVFFSLPFKIG